MSEQCSKEFVEAFHSGSGGLVRTCGCGITYYNCFDRGFYDSPKELEDLEEATRRNPAKFVPVHGDAETLIAFGHEIVVGCTCGRAKQLEQAITANRDCLLHYFGLVLDRQKKELAEDSKALTKLTGGNNESGSV